MSRLQATLGNGSAHVLRLAAELEPERALEYLAGSGIARPPHYAALDRDWLETTDGRWIRRTAIVELEVVSSGDAPGSASERPA